MNESPSPANTQTHLAWLRTRMALNARLLVQFRSPVADHPGARLHLSCSKLLHIYRLIVVNRSYFWAPRSLVVTP